MAFLDHLSCLVSCYRFDSHYATGHQWYRPALHAPSVSAVGLQFWLLNLSLSAQGPIMCLHYISDFLKYYKVRTRMSKLETFCCTEEVCGREDI